jgi:hypothetical protein
MAGTAGAYQSGNQSTNPNTQSGEEISGDIMDESRPKLRTSSTITERQKNLVDQLPNYNWNYKQTALAVGYSKSYAEKRIKGIVTKNVELCRLIEDKRLEIEARTEDLREKATRTLVEIVDNPNTTPTVRIRAIDTLGKMNGWHSATMNLETPARQRELDEAHRRAVQEFAILRRKQLAPGNVTISDVKPVTSEDNETPDTIDGNADKKSPTSPEYKADKMDENNEETIPE